ncbi:hypothetical protein [Bradyrhizobium macuxiense]|uniref:hypothetical protein n=1 Tax=Bradyrhizobium macuxiense TaxID=1755647 RepID=UPI0010A96CE2|nr:hypothetical protein [Bradyrhizobium macuxiense]
MSQNSTLALRQSAAVLKHYTELGMPCAPDDMTVKPRPNAGEQVQIEVRRSLLSASGPAMKDGTPCIADGVRSYSNDWAIKPWAFTSHGSDASLLDGSLFSVACDLGDTSNVVRF